MHITEKIRVFMEHNRILRGLVPVIRRTKLVPILHGMTLNKKDESAINRFNELYENKMEQFDGVFGLLADEKSRHIYRSIIEFRRTYNTKSLRGAVSYPQYFAEDIFDSYENEVFVDGGAYTGDTITALLKYVGG